MALAGCVGLAFGYGFDSAFGHIDSASTRLGFSKLPRVHWGVLDAEPWLYTSPYPYICGFIVAGLLAAPVGLGCSGSASALLVGANGHEITKSTLGNFFDWARLKSSGVMRLLFRK